MSSDLGHETRDVTVGSSVQRHQLKQWLKANGIEWSEPPPAPVDMMADALRQQLPETPVYVHGESERPLYVTATPAQWEGINQWLQRTKVD